MSDLYSNDAIREHAEWLVRNEVYACASMMVSTIAQAVEDACSALGLDYCDDVLPLLESEDYDEPARDRIADMDRSELCDYMESQGVEFDAGEEDDDVETIGGASVDELRALAVTAMEEQGAREFCADERIEPHRSEVFEHWIVSDYFARKLEERGETVARDFLGFTIWGRGTTGQSIAMDHVILTIARDALKD